MRLVPLLWFAATASAAYKGVVPGANHLDECNFVRNSFIIQVAGSDAALAKRGLTPARELENVLGQIKKSGIKASVRKTFDSLPAAFHGASLKVPEGTTAEDLLKIDGVQRVWPVALIHRPVVAPTYDGAAVAEEVLSAPITAKALLQNPDTRNISVFKRSLTTHAAHSASHGSSARLSKRAPVPVSSYANDQFGPHVQIGLNQAHNAGQVGQGVKIAVLDDGVDYKNPILGGCFGKGCQISFGYDFVGDDYDGTGSPAPDNDPYTECSNHGTHVTGIIAALPSSYGFTGASPGATIGHYRIMSCLGVTSDDIVVEALLKAAADGVKVISISLGGSVGWLGVTAAQITIDYLVSQGINIVVAAGNDGSEGLFFAEAPSTTVNGHSVGSVDVSILPTYQANLLNRDPIAYMAPKPLAASGAFTVYFTSTESVNNDACTALPDSTPNLANRVVVVQRGTCTYAVKYRNIAAKGGKVVLLYNSPTDLMLPQLNAANGITAVGGLTNEAGKLLLSYYKINSRSLRISFPTGPLVQAASTNVGIKDKFSGGLVSTFSGYGPTNELYGQPSYVAPGQNILSTVSLASGGVGIMRGTSEACPLAAGAAAVLLGARSADKLTPDEVKSLMSTTANRVSTTYGVGTALTVARQGSGILNVSRAIDSKTFFSPHQLLLNDTEYRTATKQVVIRNRNTFPMRYTFSSVLAPGIGVYDGPASVDILPSPQPHQVSSITPAKVAFSASAMTIAAGASATLTLTITPPVFSAANVQSFPVYSGFVTVTGTGQGTAAKGKKETHSVSYFGLAARMVDMPILDTTNLLLGANYPFIGVGNDILMGPGVLPRDGSVLILFRLAAGSRRVNVDLVDADVDFTGTVPTDNQQFRRKRSPVDEAPSRLNSRAPVLYADTPVYGLIYSPYIPGRDYLNNFASLGGAAPFSDYQIPWTGGYATADGTLANAETGKQYRVLLRALKITADPTLEASYESWLSPPFEFSA